MKCRKCGYEIPLKDTRCPKCHAKLYSVFDSLLQNIEVRLSYGYLVCYLLFGTLLPQHFAWQFQFSLAKGCTVLFALFGVILPVLAIRYLKKDTKRNQRELVFQYSIIIINLVLSIFYYDMLLRLIEYILM